MIRKIRFKYGDRVNALSLSNKRIFGEYRGLRPSFGAYVYGLIEGCTELDMHVCLTLSLERPPKEKPLKRKKLAVKFGDQCSGKTKQSITIHGKFMNSEGKFAWIKGWQEGQNRLEIPAQAYKVLTETIQPL